MVISTEAHGHCAKCKRTLKHKKSFKVPVDGKVQDVCSLCVPDRKKKMSYNQNYKVSASIDIGMSFECPGCLKPIFINSDEMEIGQIKGVVDAMNKMIKRKKHRIKSKGVVIICNKCDSELEITGFNY